MPKALDIKELLGIEVNKIYSGSEIIFLYELYKYCKQLLNVELDFGSIELIDSLKVSPYYSYAYVKGLNLNLSLSNSELTDISLISRMFFEYDLGGVVFEKKTPTEWIYDYNTDRDANLVLNMYNRSAGYVSLYAYMVVSSYKDKKKVPLLILKNTSAKQEEYEYLDVLILSNFGNRFLKDKVKIYYSKETVNQPEWEAYIQYHRQIGLMQKESSVEEKRNYIRQHFIVGDVILYYKTERPVKSKSIRKLVSCFPAVITDIGETAIKIIYYPEITTKLTRARELQEAEEAFNGEYQFTIEDYKKFLSCSVTLDYYSCGIDTFFFSEEEYLLTPMNGTDTFKQHLINKNGVESVYEMDTLNTIYTVFEDREVDYNKDRFLSTYFKDKVPMYDDIVR